MSDYNLNDPTAFAALTSAFGSAAGSPTQSKWNIVQSSYNDVPFHIFSSAQASGSAVNYSAAVPRVHDKTGRRKVFYQFPFRDGQTTGDLGRAPFTFDFEVVFFGTNYFAGYQKFYNVLNTATPGILRHPVLGDITCVASDWEVTHENSQRLALTMRVTFHEHTYTPGLVFSNNLFQGGALTSPVKPSTFKGALIAALSVFQTINAVKTAITNEVRYAKSLVNGAINLVNGIQTGVLSTLQSLYLSFSPTAISLAPDLPGLLPVNLGGQALGAGQTASVLYPLTNANQTPFSTQGTPSLSNTGPTANLTPLQAQNVVNAALAQIEAAVQLLNGATPLGGSPGQGALDFYDQVLSLKQLAIQLVQVLISGIASSQQVTTTYTVPPTLAAMCIYEVAFAIGLAMNDSDQIRQMNPNLRSVNMIPGGTVLNIPVVN